MALPEKTSDDRCWGSYTAGNQICLVCEYRDSCQIDTMSRKPPETNFSDIDYELVANSEIDTDYDHIPGNDLDDDITPDDEKRTRDLVSSLAYILRLDDYALGILLEIVAPSTEVKGKRQKSTIIK